MKKILTVLLIALVALTSAFANGTPENAEWPQKSIEVDIGANPGGDTDTTSRALAVHLTELLKQPVTIVNMAGGSGTIAADDVLSSGTDGYKMLYFHTDTVLNTVLNRCDYDWEKVFDIAAVIDAGASNCVFVGKDAPYSTMKELIAYAKDHTLSVGVETGGLVHLLALDIANKAGVKFNYVDLGGSAARVAGLLGKQIDILITVYGSARDYVTSGDFKVLGILSAERNPLLPDVPTLREQGIDSTYNHFYFFAFPKGVNPAIIQKFDDALAIAVTKDDYKEKMAKYCFTPTLFTGQKAVDYMNKVEDFFTPLAALAKKK
jgi:tripartite-type tricarboxylate transporter receptor subunit TctC